MSLHLGKIHYWLFNKVLWFEGLESEIISLAKKEGLDIKRISDEINLKHGERLPDKELEELIDKSNIHGWLQSKISSTEGRMAAWTNLILKNSNDTLEKVKNIYKGQGIKAAKEAKENRIFEGPQDIYNSMNDFILDGMPCDRVNEIIVSEDENVTWKRRVCVHKNIWESEGVNVKVFYDLRDQWAKAFVNEINDDYEYVENDNTFEIRKK